MRKNPIYQFYSAKGKAVMWEKKANGELMHLAPLGYRNTRDAQGRSIMEPDPKTFKLIQEAWRLRAEGMSIRKICKVMHKRGLRSKRGKTVGPNAMWCALAASPPSGDR